MSLGRGGGRNDVRKAAEASVDIIDIRSKAVEINLKEDILSQFHPKTGPRTLPTLLLYNERGLQLFEDVISANEYLPHLDDANMETDHVPGGVLFDQ